MSETVKWFKLGFFRQKMSVGSTDGSLLRSLMLTLIVMAAVQEQPAGAFMRRDVSGETHWTSAALQGAAGQGAFSESWVDQAHTDVSLLARRKSNFEIQLLSGAVVISRDASQAIEKTVKTFQESSNDSTSGTAAQSTVKALNEVRSIFGKTLTTQLHTNFLSMRIKRIGIAPYSTGFLDAAIDNAAWPKLDASVGGYAGILLSYAQAIGKDFDFGAALRPGLGLHQTYTLDLSLLGDVIVDSSNASQSLEKFKSFPSAVYLPLDLGVAWWAGASTRLHLVSKNTFDATPVSTINGSPGVLQSRINLGFSHLIPISKGQIQTLLLGGELQDMAGLRGGWNELLMRLQWAGRYAVRLPFRDKTSFAVNVGLKSGYPVASLFFDLFLAKIELALSARENGAYSGQRVNRLQTISVNTQMQF